MTLNCIAIDDEPLALGLICAFIEQTPFLHLAGRYTNGAAAFAALNDQAVQVIFLDIQMPDLTGMQLAHILGQQRSVSGPRIIFTTAYNHFALEGYKVDALDYLLKPFHYDEFLRAANKARGYFELLQQNGGVAPEEVNYIFLKAEYQLIKISFEDILYIEGVKDYIRVHLRGGAKPVMSLTSLRALEEKLPAKHFMRVHRSFIVSLSKIDAITKSTIHIGDAVITVGEQYKEQVRQFAIKWTI
jgi:DNA-binding LytR/AlgR family response regulator